MKHTRTILTCLTAALVLACCTSIASANRISISHNLQRAIWSSLHFGAFGVTAAACPLTLERSFHSATIAKVERALIGYVTKATLGACTTGAATILKETLPWHVTYDGFLGTLPTPTGIKLLLVGAAFQINGGIFGTCLTKSSTTNPMVGIGEGITYEARGNGIQTKVRVEEGAKIPCGANNGEFTGTGSLTEASGSVNVLIRLI